MSDGRWFETDADIETAVRHFRQSVALYREGGFDAPGLAGYRAIMALMHALQAAHTSLESALVRILDMQPLFFYLVGLGSVLVTKRGRRLGDIVAGTIVVRE